MKHKQFVLSTTFNLTVVTLLHCLRIH